MPRSFVFLIVIGFTLGVLFGEFVAFQWLLGLSGIALFVGSWTRHRGVVTLFIVAVLCGAGRITLVLAHHDRAAQVLLLNTDEVQGVAIKRWAEREETTVEVKNLRWRNVEVPGTVRIRLASSQNVRVGQNVTIQCRWRTFLPERKKRMASQGLMAECYYPEVFHVGGQSRHWRAYLARARAALVERINDSYHSPQSDLLAGILLGIQETMTADLREGFRATGTSHIVALSGFNVTIIITVMAGTLTTIVGRRLAFWPTAVLVILFVVMTGASASVTRAGVMSLVVLVSSQLGRPIAMARILSYTFIGMVALNPLIVRYDLGFQLSFLATLGLVYVAGALEERWKNLPATLGLRGNFSTTIAAMVVTEPLLLWTFGRLSIVAPVVNLAVLPFIPLIMAVGTLALILPIAVPLADALLRLVLAIIGTAGSWSLAQMSTPWWWAGGLAGWCFFFVIRLLYGASKKIPTPR